MLLLYWRNFIRPYWPMVATSIASFVLASSAGLAAPLVIKFLIDDALGRADLGYLHSIVAGIVVLYLIRGIFSYIHGYTIAKASNYFIAKVRQSMYSRLQKLDYVHFHNTTTGEMVSLFTNDLGLLQQAVTVGLGDLIVESLNVLAIMCIMIYFDWQLACVTFATLPFIILAIGFFNKKIANLGMLVEQTLAKVTTILHQSILSVMMVQSYVREDYEHGRFRDKVYQVASDFLKLQRLNAVLVSLVEFLAAMGLTVIIWYGGREVIQGNLTIGGMFAFLIYIINVPMPLRKISQAITQLKLGVVAWERLQTLEQEKINIVDGPNTIEAVRGVVEFRSVHFSYQPNQNTLQDIDVSAQPGDMIAIVGPSGAGKSSFANLLLRFYDPSAGAIYLDGMDIRQLTIEGLRRNIGFIQQEPTLFNMSIRENIAYGRPEATQAEVEAAARQAQAHDFIMELPGGYEYHVGEQGTQLSGGQRQRIAIARAMILDPAILVLDEPTAALDAQSEQQVMAAIRAVSRGRTTFIITHRLMTLVDSDKVIYLANGRILEAGTHAELVAKGGLYAKAVLSEEMCFTA